MKKMFIRSIAIVMFFVLPTQYKAKAVDTSLYLVLSQVNAIYENYEPITKKLEETKESLKMHKHPSERVFFIFGLENVGWDQIKTIDHGVSVEEYNDKLYYPTIDGDILKWHVYAYHKNVIQMISTDNMTKITIFGDNIATDIDIGDYFNSGDIIGSAIGKVGMNCYYFKLEDSTWNTGDCKFAANKENPSPYWLEPLPNRLEADHQIYKKASAYSNIDWEILSAVHCSETGAAKDFNGKTCKRHTANPRSYAGARGCMQFIPSTFRTYGIDGDGDGKADINNCIDSIYSAANYISKNYHKSGSYRIAIYRYNHANWYVNKVMNIASILGYN
jgi:hypothetical protein